MRIIEKFDRHCILYSAGIGVILNIMFGPKLEIIKAAFYFGALGGFCWYALKAIFITACTITNWHRDHPGEPMIHAGGLTEYDREFAETVGKAARGESTDDAKLTAYDKEKAEAIGRSSRQ